MPGRATPDRRMTRRPAGRPSPCSSPRERWLPADRRAGGGLEPRSAEAFDMPTSGAPRGRRRRTGPQTDRPRCSTPGSPGSAVGPLRSCARPVARCQFLAPKWPGIDGGRWLGKAHDRGLVGKDGKDRKAASGLSRPILSSLTPWRERVCLRPGSFSGSPQQIPFGRRGARNRAEISGRTAYRPLLLPSAVCLLPLPIQRQMPIRGL